MERNSDILIGLLAIADGLFYVGSELNKTRRICEATVKAKEKKEAAQR